MDPLDPNLEPDALGPDGLARKQQPLPPQPAPAGGEGGNGVGDAVGGAGLLADVGEGVSSAASVTVDTLSSGASGAAEAVGGAVEAVGGAVEGLGGAVEGIGSAVGGAAEGCGSCSLAVLVMLASVGAAVAAVLR